MRQKEDKQSAERLNRLQEGWHSQNIEKLKATIPDKNRWDVTCNLSIHQIPSSPLLKVGKNRYMIKADAKITPESNIEQKLREEFLVLQHF